MKKYRLFFWCSGAFSLFTVCLSLMFELIFENRPLVWVFLMVSILAWYGMFIFWHLIGKEHNKKDADLSLRITAASNALKKTSADISNLQKELEQRIHLVEKLKRDATESENIIALSAEQVRAITSKWSRELRDEGRKGFWRGVAVNFIFFVFGAVISLMLMRLT